MHVHDVPPRMHGLGMRLFHQLVVTRKAMLFKFAQFLNSGKADEFPVKKTCFFKVRT